MQSASERRPVDLFSGQAGKLAEDVNPSRSAHTTQRGARPREQVCLTDRGLGGENHDRLDAPDETIHGFRSAWAAIGDSIVVVGGDGIWNCHVHTNDIGAAVEAGIDAGRPHSIRVTDLMEQVEEERWVREAVEDE